MTLEFAHDALESGAGVGAGDVGELGVASGGSGAGMAEQRLYLAQVHTGLEEVRNAAVA